MLVVKNKEGSIFFESAVKGEEPTKKEGNTYLLGKEAFELLRKYEVEPVYSSEGKKLSPSKHAMTDAEREVIEKLQAPSVKVAAETKKAAIEALKKSRIVKKDLAAEAD